MLLDNPTLPVDLDLSKLRSGRWWRTEEPSVLPSMGSHRQTAAVMLPLEEEDEFDYTEFFSHRFSFLLI